MTGGKRPGFTLIEMLVVVTIFSTMAVVMAQIFVSFNRLQRQISNRAVLGQDMRFATELLVRSARSNQIDYSSQPLLGSDTTLKLVTSAGTPIWVGVRPGGAAGDCQDATVAQCLALSLDSGTTWSPITAKRVDVTNFSVYVRPSDSPFVPSGGSYVNNIQPFVTFHIALEYRAPNATDDAKLEAQTTVSSRVYLR